MDRFITKALTTTSTGIAFLATALPAFAQNRNVGVTCDKVNQATEGSLRVPCALGVSDIIGKVIALLFIAAALLAFLFLIIGGIRWILSGGDKEGTAKARAMITAAIIGLAIVFLSFVIITILGQVLGFNIFNLTLPSFGG